MTAPDLTARDVALAKYTKEDPIFSPRGERISSRLYVDTHAMADALVTAERERDAAVARLRVIATEVLSDVVLGSVDTSEEACAIACARQPDRNDPEVTDDDRYGALCVAIDDLRVRLESPPTEARTDG